jgi:hypothetical protein
LGAFISDGISLKRKWRELAKGMKRAKSQSIVLKRGNSSPRLYFFFSPVTPSDCSFSSATTHITPPSSLLEEARDGGVLRGRNQIGRWADAVAVFTQEHEQLESGGVIGSTPTPTFKISRTGTT